MKNPCPISVPSIDDDGYMLRTFMVVPDSISGIASIMVWVMTMFDMTFPLPPIAYILSWSGYVLFTLKPCQTKQLMMITNANATLKPTATMTVYILFLDRNLR